MPLPAWDGDYLVYNPLSGNTHILDIVSGEVLKIIASRPVRANALSRRIAEFLELPVADDGVERHVEATLGILDELGLIEPTGGC